jgi:tetrahydromethanopterin S-methyltransferase subunit E
MKKLAATLLMTGVLAVAGFAAPASAAPKDLDSTTSSTSNTSTNHETVGWWPH